MSKSLFPRAASTGATLSSQSSTLDVDYVAGVKNQIDVSKRGRNLRPGLADGGREVGVGNQPYAHCVGEWRWPEDSRRMTEPARGLRASSALGIPPRPDVSRTSATLSTSLAVLKK